MYTKAWYANDPSKQCRDCHWKVDVGIDAFGGREVWIVTPIVESQLTID